MKADQRKETISKMEIADQIIIYRRQCSLTQEELADRVGVSRQAVSKWETGESMPDFPKMVQLADAFGISLDRLCGREPGENEEPVKNPGKSSYSGGKRLLYTLLLLAALLAAGLVGYSIGKSANGNESEVKKTVPDRLKVYDVAFEYDGKTLTGTFVTNYESDTAWYRAEMTDLFNNKKEGVVTHKDGVFQATFDGITGTGTRIDLIMKEGDTELTENIAKGISVTQSFDKETWGVSFGRNTGD